MSPGPQCLGPQCPDLNVWDLNVRDLIVIAPFEKLERVVNRMASSFYYYFYYKGEVRCHVPKS